MSLNFIKNMFTAQAHLRTQSRGTLLSSTEITGATQPALEASAEHWAQQTLHDLGYRSIPYAEGYWLREGMLKRHDWGTIVLTLELTEERRNSLYHVDRHIERSYLETTCLPPTR